LSTIIIPVITGCIMSGLFVLGFLIGRADRKDEEGYEQRREDRARPSDYSITPIHPAIQDGVGEYEEQAEGGQDQD
jgi:hypothetical protein